jgi:hypothetical protein
MKYIKVYLKTNFMENTKLLFKLWFAFAVLILMLMHPAIMLFLTFGGIIYFLFFFMLYLSNKVYDIDTKSKQEEPIKNA